MTNYSKLFKEFKNSKIEGVNIYGGTGGSSTTTGDTYCWRNGKKVSDDCDVDDPDTIALPKPLPGDTTGN